MTKGVVHERREKFIRLMVDVTTAKEMIAVYMACFPNCKKETSARSACYRMLHDDYIVKGIDALKKEKEEMIKRAQQKEIERQAREKVITEIQIDAKLSDIVMGHHKRKKKVAVYDAKAAAFRTGTIEEEPDHKAIISAATVLYRRKGSLTPEKIQHEAGDSFIEAMQALSAKRNQEGGNV